MADAAGPHAASEEPTTEEIEALKRGVALMQTRPFGEQFAEVLVCERFGLAKPIGQRHHDLLGGSDEPRVEVKFARIFSRSRSDAPSLADHIAGCGRGFASNKQAFVANFQKILPEELDALVYGLVFDEGVDIYRAPCKAITTGPQHHGVPTIQQFSMTQSKRVDHEAHFVESVSWPEIWRILRKLPAPTKSSRTRRRKEAP